MKEQKKTGKTKTKNTETIIKKQNDIIKDIEKRKPIELKQSKEERCGREKFNILAKAKQQLIQCEICNCQIKGGNSDFARHSKTSAHINNIEKIAEQ